MLECGLFSWIMLLCTYLLYYAHIYGDVILDKGIYIENGDE